MKKVIESSISIIISAYNEEKYIWACLESILQNAGPEVLEIIVIDNASTDKTKIIAQSYGIKVIQEDKQGVSFARQRWFQESSGDIIAFLDADTRMPKGWTMKVSTFFLEERVSFVSWPYFYYDLRLYENVIFYISPLSYLCTFIIWPIGVGGNMAIRRSTLVQVGGFDTSIQFYGDDTDIARRMAKVGKAIFSPRLVMPTSGRRLKHLGVFRTYIIYFVNYLSVSLFHRVYHNEEEKKFR